MGLTIPNPNQGARRPKFLQQGTLIGRQTFECLGMDVGMDKDMSMDLDTGMYKQLFVKHQNPTRAHVFEIQDLTQLFVSCCYGYSYFRC